MAHRNYRNNREAPRHRKPLSNKFDYIAGGIIGAFIVFALILVLTHGG